MKKMFIILVLIFVFSIPVNAEESNYTSDIYDIVDGEELSSILDDNTRKHFEKYGINATDPDWVNNISSQNVFSHIKDFLISGLKSPVKSGAAILGIILITSAITSFGRNESKYTPALYAGTLAATAIISGQIWQSIFAAVNALKGITVFMFSFIPIFASVTALSGHGATSISMSSLLLVATQVISSLSSFFIMPIMGGYLSLSIASSASPLISKSEAAQAIKKIALWLVSLLSTVFVGILGIQTAVNSATDSIAMKTTKFIVGTCVPVAGTALGEATSTIYSSLGVLRSSVGIYGVVAICTIIFPIVAELYIWRLILTVTASVADIFSLPKISALLKAVDTMISVLSAILLLVTGLFVISLTIVVSAGK